MDNLNGKIVIIGAGSIGTAMGQVLASKEELNVHLLTIEKEVAASINNTHLNNKYFPNIRLHTTLNASTDEEILREAGIIFLAIPSVVVVDYLRQQKSKLPSQALLVNLAKGFCKENRIITECLGEKFKNPVCALKGPTFAREIINNSPTGFTLATEHQDLFKIFSDLFAGTNIFLDFSTDLRGVELLSIFKNVYAIIIGIVDAHFNSTNLRFLVLTRAFNEMRELLLLFGGREETMFNYCGYGDFSLTALNDLSRNRTLGLLIGKGFFTENISDKVVLEGRIALNVIMEKILAHNRSVDEFPMIGELHKVFNQDYPLSHFVNNILDKERTLYIDF
jgi:glycerol-3-phosphate dehydrogenase (NAD(P)+)